MGQLEVEARRLQRRAAQALQARRAALLARHGWARLELDCAADPRRRALAVRGEAVTERARGAALADLRAVLPPGWTLDAAVELAAPLGWFALPPGISRLYAAPHPADLMGCPIGHDFRDARAGGSSGRHGARRDGRARWIAGPGGAGSVCPFGHVVQDMSMRTGQAHAGGLRSGWSLGRGVPDMPWGTTQGEVFVRAAEDLCTELAAGDGPVALLARAGASALVRGRDGTVGWTRAALGPAVAAPGRAHVTCPGGQAAERLGRALRAYRGTPYRLGGATQAQVDCSGLVQRCVRDALGVVLPRHSTDQLGLGEVPTRALGEPGDLLFVWGPGEAACHVGVVLPGERPGRRTVVHASSRRGRVVEEPLERVLTRASLIRHLELEQVLAMRP